MLILNKSILSSIPHYRVNPDLGKYLTEKYKLIILSKQNDGWYFRKNKQSNIIIEEEIPLLYRCFGNIFEGGGEEN